MLCPLPLYSLSDDFMEQSGAFKLSKEGFVLLQFAPAAGVRQYDWSRKQVILTFSVGFPHFSCEE